MNIDVFNGDADGIFSLIQLRKEFSVAPSQQLLVTGVKRDHALLQHVTDQQAQGADIQVLDLPFDKNSAELPRLLKVARSVSYIDHHFATTQLTHKRLVTLFDFAPTVCTGLLVSAHLRHNQLIWAVPAAFGDNLYAEAYEQCRRLGLSPAAAELLRELGMLVNYNSYGLSLADVHIAPATLYQQLMAYESPLAVVADGSATAPFKRLQQGYAADIELAQSAEVLAATPALRAVLLPAAAWARRINGTLANQLAEEFPHQAIVMVTLNPDGQSYYINLRAPQSNRSGAGDICARYPNGGGRAGAGGINALPLTELDALIETVNDYYSL